MGESSDGGNADGHDEAAHHEELEKVESWLDEHPHFVHDYFVRKASRQMVDSWLLSHSAPQGMVPESSSSNSSPTSPSSGAATPVRKISAHEFEKSGLLRPILNTTVDGIPTFLSLPLPGDAAPQCNSHVGRKSRQELRALDERELIFELVKDICNDLEIRSLCHKILQNVSILTDADRCSLFLVRGDKGDPTRCLVSQLFDVSCSSTMEQMQQKEEIRIPWGTGIVGYVAESRESLNIPDCYQDDRFNSRVDQKTGYTTRNMLCMPILDVDGEVKGVAQIINKCGGEEPFMDADEKVFSRYLQFCGIGLRNAELYERSELENKRNQVLLDLARMVFEEQSTIEHIVYRIMTHTQSLLQCERCQVLLVDENTKTFSRVFDLDVNDMNAEDADSRKSPFEGRFPINVGITGYVATTGETLNIPDVLQDDRFDPAVDGGSGFRHYSVLCMPIRNASNKIVGVSQLINKLSGAPFNKNDEHLFEAFAIFCGMGIQNTQMYERAVKAIAKTKVTLEVLSYHATAPIEEAKALSKCIVPSTHVYRLQDLKFNDFSLDDEDMLKACLRMFMDLDLIERFRINYDVLCRWLLSVRKNYRPVTYHNWRHAFNVSQMMFACLTITKLWHIFGEVETLSLLIACLCHDLDHRGTNNSFQIKSCSPLAQLYSTSTMEHHHFDQCIMILNSEGNQILSHLSPDEYSNVVHVLEDAILATDLAVYFRRRSTFFHMVDSGKYNWKREDNRELLRAMLMTVCDIAAITKPWEIQRVVAELVASEFFQQGDIEKEQLKIQPIDMMNREKKDELPLMQVRFIDSICAPVYESFAKISDKLQPLMDGVQQNREQWLKLAEARNLCNFHDK
ncbi:dual 3',5'-cyclic-AMP and -GMP phosphodiesterase 11-like isoform X2 [Argiope bruennichi]|nr:dual 3',5'-cyclic-AMP and -GMP phosphodiesterase 11-like isoform X2 [Argiope bruennichi]XP_055948616.1 dual 3',5'-cyclic-AMP and -GMP phosphodiesterase 11-like isoform X2 [Argiope bruennichi]XP_055948617.1 dual 3',5'-cyclic-AMP and -GMP phosphodiesterase 11-like isoform X2 [Argiope bruennichi]